MNNLDVFWKIAAGSKFDFKRFHSDAEKLKIIKAKNKASNDDGSGTGQSGLGTNMKNAERVLDVQCAENMKSHIVHLKNSIADGSAVTEFQKLYREKPGLTMNTAKLPASRSSNRYSDILPYDQTRVKLSGIHHYINANYINMPVLISPSKEEIHRYIATQGPLPNTVADFWRMVWEKKVTHVVMLTAEAEKSVVKCHQYWPVSTGQSATWGQLTVEFVEERETKTATFRKFQLSSNERRSQESHVINQFQYIGWPDHGVPHEHADFLRFVHEVQETCDNFNGPNPTVIHCSAGIGRTGVFIGLVTAVQMLKVGQPFNMLDLVKRMRDQRVGCVQTAEQYRFLCEAVLEVYNELFNSNNSASGTLESSDHENDSLSDSFEFDDSSSENERLSIGDDDESNSDTNMDRDDADEVTKPRDSKSSTEIERISERRKRKEKTLTTEKLAKIRQEEVNHFRNVNHLRVYGTDIPEPIKTFEELQTRYHVNTRIVENLQSLKFHTPTVIEMQGIPVMMHRRELMACAPTGCGKTLAFVLPILHHLESPKKDGFRALCLAPTRELAEQTCREFNRIGDGLGIRVHFIHSVNDDLKKFGAELFKKFDILVTTPNRLVYLLQQDQSLSLSSVQWLVIDESDKLFEDGKTGFRDQLATIYKACDSKDIRRAMFSATFSYDVEEWCKLNLDNVVQVYVGVQNAVAQTIEQKLLYVGDESGKLLAMRDIIHKGFQPPMLVFVQSKERAKELFQALAFEGVRVDVIHADKTQSQRDNIVSAFRSGEIWILICTDVMCRGMDFKAVNIVINYDFPNSDYVYIHRIGRTGRAGRQGKAITFFTDTDTVNLRCIANKMREAGCEVPDYMLTMKAPNRQLKRKLEKTAPKRQAITRDVIEPTKKKKKRSKSTQKQ